MPPPRFLLSNFFFLYDHLSFNLYRMNQSISFYKSMEWTENKMNISLYKWCSLIQKVCYNHERYQALVLFRVKKYTHQVQSFYSCVCLFPQECQQLRVKNLDTDIDTVPNVATFSSRYGRKITENTYVSFLIFFFNFIKYLYNINPFVLSISMNFLLNFIL